MISVVAYFNINISVKLNSMKNFAIYREIEKSDIISNTRNFETVPFNNLIY